MTEQEVTFHAETLDKLLEMLKDHIESIESNYIPYRYWNRHIDMYHDNEYGYGVRISFEVTH